MRARLSLDVIAQIVQISAGDTPQYSFDLPPRGNTPMTFHTLQRFSEDHFERFGTITGEVFRVVRMKSLLLSLLVTAEMLAQPVEYPLHRGDTWQYRNAAVMTGDTFVYSYTALSDTLLGGKTYTVTYFGNNPVSIQRQSGDSVFLYRPGAERELLYFDFARTVGDTVSTTVLGNDTMDVILSHTDVANIFGGSRRTWEFYVNRSRTTVDDEYSVVVADSLGIVGQYPSFGDPSALVGAVIDGRVYGTVLSVRDDRKNTPSSYTLSQNYPNPFNPSTTIRFSVPTRSRVRLTIFNLLGQQVAELANEEMGAGNFERTWNANVASGLYFYRLEAVSLSNLGKRFVDVKKMVLVK
jgi:hypothetical protein